MDIGTLNLSHLKYFVDTVENQSLTVAADLNFVTRPAISQAIKKLEDWYNTDLLIHQKKKFKLTKAGEDFYPLAKGILSSISTQLTKTTSDTSLKVGCSSSLLDSFFLPALSKIKRPELHLKLGPSPFLRSMLEERKINLAILIDDQKMPDFITESLYAGEFIFLGKASETIVCTEDRPEVLELKREFRNSGHNFIQADSWGRPSSWPVP
jgi:DNA-binding transcriptional LysR family regulator